MKRLLSVLGSFVILSGTASGIVSCNFSPINGGSGGGDKPSPPKPVIKNIKYYQTLLKNTNDTINQFNAGIKELKKWKNTIDNYDKVLAELIAEKNSYQAVAEDCNYYILLLQTDGNFNDSQLLLVKEYLNNELNYLQNELKTKQNYKNDYSFNELKQINQDISLVKSELAKYL